MCCIRRVCWIPAEGRVRSVKDGIHPSGYVAREPKKQTNADWIRTMSDEELAEFLSEVKADGIYYNGGMEYPIISEVWKEWLQSEVEE